jgi:hypothetical protein
MDMAALAQVIAAPELRPPKIEATPLRAGAG